MTEDDAVASDSSSYMATAIQSDPNSVSFSVTGLEGAQPLNDCLRIGGMEVMKQDLRTDHRPHSKIQFQR